MKIWMIHKILDKSDDYKILNNMIRLEKTFSASVQAPAAIVWECAACKQGVNDNDGGGGATAQWPNIVWSRIWILIPLCFDELFF